MISQENASKHHLGTKKVTGLFTYTQKISDPHGSKRSTYKSYIYKYRKVRKNDQDPYIYSDKKWAKDTNIIYNQHIYKAIYINRKVRKKLRIRTFK